MLTIFGPASQIGFKEPGDFVWWKYFIFDAVQIGCKILRKCLPSERSGENSSRMVCAKLSLVLDFRQLNSISLEVNWRSLCSSASERQPGHFSVTASFSRDVIEVPPPTSSYLSLTLSDKFFLCCSWTGQAAFSAVLLRSHTWLDRLSFSPLHRGQW